MRIYKESRVYVGSITAECRVEVEDDELRIGNSTGVAAAITAINQLIDDDLKGFEERIQKQPEA